jgi:hypothetical protein
MLNTTDDHVRDCIVTSDRAVGEVVLGLHTGHAAIGVAPPMTTQEKCLSWLRPGVVPPGVRDVRWATLIPAASRPLPPIVRARYRRCPAGEFPRR